MESPGGCELCGQPIDVGEAWMTADEEGARRVAHAGCVYREEPNADEHADWVPQEPLTTR